MRDPDILGKAVKNKTLFELHDYFVFLTNLGASLFCFSVMAQIRSIFYTNVRRGGVLISLVNFLSRKKVTNIRMKVKINK
ncbi:MAG: hypothetical protein RL060_1855 [Bacteroidota bacterium]